MEDLDYANSDTIVVSPIAKRVTFKPGETYESSIKITNPSGATKAVHYKIEVSPYSVLNENYDADLKNSSAYNKILDWIKVSEPEGEIQPGETKEVAYVINVPEDARSGGQYCAIGVQQLPSTEGGNSVKIDNVLEITSLLYSQIGDVEYAGEIVKNDIPGFSFMNPVTTSMTVKNTGNVHQDATVTIKAYYALTGQQIALKSETGTSEEDDSVTNGVDTYSELIMPESTRYSTHQVRGLPSLGVFKMTQEVYFDGKTDTKEQIMIMCPLWFIALVVLAIAAITGMILYRKKAGKKNKEKKVAEKEG